MSSYPFPDDNSSQPIRTSLQTIFLYICMNPIHHQSRISIRNTHTKKYKLRLKQSYVDTRQLTGLLLHVTFDRVFAYIVFPPQFLFFLLFFFATTASSESWQLVNNKNQKNSRQI